jgi:hypothetical protein
VRSSRAVVVLGVVAVVSASLVAIPDSTSEGAEPATASDQAGEIARLRDEIERLKGMLPDQSHVMKDVAYHFSNLWFAAQAQNWPLAAFYLGETRSHLRWAVRVRPVRQTAAGSIDLRSILDGLDRSLLTDLQKTVEARDLAAFSKAYQGALAGCYACHQASEKPYLRPHVPVAPEGRMIDFAPALSGQ